MGRDVLSLQKFVGRWSLAREIVDTAGGREGALAGEAVFRPEGGNIVYEEKGELSMHGLAPLMAERRYLWRERPDRTIAVHFEDGRPFHRISLDQTMPFDTHFCAPDVYDMAYDFRNWPAWECRTRVEGPRKTYRLLSRYQYLGPLDSVAETCD